MGRVLRVVGQFAASLEFSEGAILESLRAIWRSMEQFGRFSEILDQFGRFWSILEQFETVRYSFFEQFGAI